MIGYIINLQYHDYIVSTGNHYYTEIILACNMLFCGAFNIHHLYVIGHSNMYTYTNLHIYYIYIYMLY